MTASDLIMYLPNAASMKRYDTNTPYYTKGLFKVNKKTPGILLSTLDKFDILFFQGSL